MTDLSRLYTGLSDLSGVSRTIVPSLEREAAEWAARAVEQVGFDYVEGAPPGPGGGIPHPGATVQRDELDWPPTIDLGEIATWNYLQSDPIGAAIAGLWGSAPHRAVLVNPYWDHWGAGIHTAFKPGDDVSNPLLMRTYIRIWVASDEVVESRFPDVVPGDPFYASIERLAAAGIVTGRGDGLYHPTDPITRGEVAAIVDRALRTLS